MIITLKMWPQRNSNHATTKVNQRSQVTDTQWFLIADFFPWKPPTRVGGRPKIHPRECFEGILWILRTGSQWQYLPKHFPSYTTCWRRLRDWTRSGIWQQAWARLLSLAHDLKLLDWEQLLADGTFLPAKKGGKKPIMDVRALAVTCSC